MSRDTRTFCSWRRRGCIRAYLNSEHTGLKYARKKKDSHTFEGLHSGVSRVPHLAHRLDRVIPCLRDLGIVQHAEDSGYVSCLFVSQFLDLELSYLLDNLWIDRSSSTRCKINFKHLSNGRSNNHRFVSLIFETPLFQHSASISYKHLPNRSKLIVSPSQPFQIESFQETPSNIHRPESHYHPVQKNGSSSSSSP